MGTLTILPTTLSAGDWAMSRTRGGAVFGYPALSHSQFVRMAHRSVHPDQVWLTEGESFAALACVVDEYYSKRPDAPFAGLRRRSGFWRSLQRFLNECRRACFNRGELAPALSAGTGERRASFLSELYDAYGDRLAALNATDAAHAEAGLTADLSSSWNRISFLAGLDDIEIRGIYDIKPATFEWILEVSRHIPTTIFLPLPKDHPRSIRWLEWTYRKFEYLGDEAPTGLTVQSEDLQTDRALSELLPRLFQPLAQLKEQHITPLGSHLPLHILAADDPRTEVIEIARRVKSLWQTGAALSRIAVLFRRPDVYPNAPDAFSAFGIPVDVSRDLHAEWHPDLLTRETLDLASLAANGFDREDLLGWIGRTHCALPDPLHDPDLGRMLREARLIRGKPAELSERLLHYASTSKDAAFQDRIKAASAALKQTLGKASRLSQPSTPLRYLRHLKEALEDAGLGQAEDISNLFEQFARLGRILEGWDNEMDPSILCDLLEGALSGTASAEKGAGVRLLSVHDVAGIQIDHLFIAGLTAGSFPEEPKQEVFLKDPERHEISAAYAKRHRDTLGPRLAGHRPFDTAKEERLRENFLFFLCLAQPAHSVTLSYPKLDSQGRPATPSPYIDEIYKQFEHPDALLAAAESALRPRTRWELEREAIEGIDAGRCDLLVEDAGRILRIAERVDVERRREQFYLERNRDRRSTLAFEYTGRLAGRGPFWTRADMSVRALEAFAGCPFKGFAGHIAGIRDVDRPVEGLSAKDLGTLLHRFLENLWKALKREFDSSQRDIDSVLMTARRIAPQVLDEAARQMTLPGAADPGPLWRSQKTALTYLIESILDREEESLKAGYWPAGLEMNVSLNLHSESNAPPSRLIGRVDRLDHGADGSIRIVDYKLSDVTFLRDKKNKIGVTEIQLPAYASAVTALEKSDPQKQIRLLYVSLRHAAQTLEAWIGTAQELTALFNPSAILDDVHAGRFDVTPEDETLCEHCEFRRACRVQDVLSSRDPAETES